MAPITVFVNIRIPVGCACPSCADVVEHKAVEFRVEVDPETRSARLDQSSLMELCDMRSVDILDAETLEDRARAASAPPPAGDDW